MERKKKKKKKKKKDPNFCASLERLQLTSLLYGWFVGSINARVMSYFCDLLAIFRFVLVLRCKINSIHSIKCG
jgi:hypothetical protein